MNGAGFNRCKWSSITSEVVLLGVGGLSVLQYDAVFPVDAAMRSHYDRAQSGAPPCRTESRDNEGSACQDLEHR